MKINEYAYQDARTKFIESWECGITVDGCLKAFLETYLKSTETKLDPVFMTDEVYTPS